MQESKFMKQFDRQVKRAMVRANKYPEQLTREEKELLTLVIQLADELPEEVTDETTNK